VSAQFMVVSVDSYGYNVYPSHGDPWDKDLANAVTLIARASYALSKELGKPIGTIKIDWPDGTTAVVRVGSNGVVGIIVEAAGEAPAAQGKASAEGLV